MYRVSGPLDVLARPRLQAAPRATFLRVTIAAAAAGRELPVAATTGLPVAATTGLPTATHDSLLATVQGIVQGDSG